MNLNNIDNIRIVIELLKEHDIHYIVISPGGTNIEFVRLVQNDSFFKCYSIVDERSAIYFAIGLYLYTGETIATSCTSAQATRNYIPGLTEAFYKRVPILAITMEKHPRFIGQEYMQAPNQGSLPDDCIKRSFSLPYISDENDYLTSIRVTNDAILEINQHGKGPVQLCIPWLDFPLGDIKSYIRKIERKNTFDCSELSCLSKKIMIVIGEYRKFNSEEIYAIEKFTDLTDTVVYTNHLSNYHGKYSFHADLELTSMSVDNFNKNFVPDLLITIGGQTGDYPLYMMISRPQVQICEHWRVSEDKKLIDTYDKLTKIFGCSIEEFFKGAIKHLKDQTSVKHQYYEKWMDLVRDNTLDTIDIPLSNCYIAQNMYKIIPENSIMQFSILNSLRVWSLFPLDSSIQCFSNVGAFGIDGGLSTLIGISMETNQLCYMIIGDLAFYYDMNSIAIRHIKNNLRIIIINNNGGIEFKLGVKNKKGLDDYISASGHFNNAEGWAKTCQYEYISVKTKQDFLDNREKLIMHSDKPIIMEVFMTDEAENDAYYKIINSNLSLTTGEATTREIKQSIKRVLGQNTIDKIRRRNKYNVL